LDDAGAGTITFDGTTSFTGSAALSASTSRDIVVSAGGSVKTVDGALALRANQQSAATQGNFSGIVVSGIVEATGTGVVTIEGHAGTGSTSADLAGVKLDGGRISGGTSGVLTVKGDAGAGTGQALIGVSLGNSGSINSSGARVDVTGKGGDGPGAHHRGISLAASTQIIAGGSGAVNVTGTGGGGSGSNHTGILVKGGTITSSGGNVAVTGVSGGTAASADAFGLLVEDSGTITAGGTGTITVSGRGGAGTGANSHGIVVANNGKLTSGSGPLVVQGAAGNASSTGIVLVSTISHTGSGSSGQIEIATDSIDFFGSGAITAGDNSVVLKPLTVGAGINLGPLAAGSGDVTKPGDTITKYPANAVDAGPQFVAAKAIDNQANTKYALRDGAGKGFEVTLGSGAAVVTELKLTTAADLKDRDPGSYKLEGKTQGGAYALIKEGTLSLPDARSAATTIPLNNSVPYATYRLTFPSMRSGSGETTLQIGEVELLGKLVSLELTDAELDKVATGTLIIGAKNSGKIKLTENITRSAKTDVELVTGQTVEKGNFTIDTAGGRLVDGSGSSQGSQLSLDLSNANSNLAITNDGTNYVLTLTGTNWQGTDNTHVTGYGTNKLLVTPAGQTQFGTIKITDSAAGGSVTFNDSGSNAYGDTFIVELDEAGAGTITFNGTTSFAGGAALSISTSRNIVVSSGAIVKTVDGALTLRANQQSAPTDGDFVGVDVRGTVETTGSGTIQVNGRGGSGTGANNHGVNVASGAKITSAGGSLVVQGTPGKTTGTGIVVDSEISHTGTGSGIALVTDSIDITTTNGAVSGGADNTVQISPGTPGTSINIGAPAYTNVVTPGISVGTVLGKEVTGFGAKNAIDGRADTKYVATYQTQCCSNANALWMDLGRGNPMPVIGLKLTTAGDSQGLDPKEYKLQGRRSPNQSFVDVVGWSALALPSARTASTVLYFNNDTVYETYQLVFRGGAGATMQIGEVELLVGEMGLTDTALNRVTAGTLRIGDFNSGLITILADISRPAKTNLQLTSGNSVDQNGKTIDTAGGYLHVNQNGRITDGKFVDRGGLRFYTSGAFTNDSTNDPVQVGYVPAKVPDDVTSPSDSLSSFYRKSVFDNDKNTYVNVGTNNAFEVTPARGSTVVTGLTLTSSYRYDRSDPASYKLEGKPPNGSYVLIAEGDVQFPEARRTSTFTTQFSNTAAYTSYRLTFPKANPAGQYAEVAEVELIGIVERDFVPLLDLPSGVTLQADKFSTKGKVSAIDGSGFRDLFSGSVGDVPFADLKGSGFAIPSNQALTSKIDAGTSFKPTKLQLTLPDGQNKTETSRVELQGDLGFAALDGGGVRLEGANKLVGGANGFSPVVSSGTLPVGSSVLTLAGLKFQGDKMTAQHSAVDKRFRFGGEATASFDGGSTTVELTQSGIVGKISGWGSVRTNDWLEIVMPSVPATVERLTINQRYVDYWYNGDHDPRSYELEGKTADGKYVAIKSGAINFQKKQKSSDVLHVPITNTVVYSAYRIRFPSGGNAYNNVHFGDIELRGKSDGLVIKDGQVLSASLLVKSLTLGGVSFKTDGLTATMDHAARKVTFTGKTSTLSGSEVDPKNPRNLASFGTVGFGVAIDSDTRVGPTIEIKDGKLQDFSLPLTTLSNSTFTFTNRGQPNMRAEYDPASKGFKITGTSQTLVRKGSISAISRSNDTTFSADVRMDAVFDVTRPADAVSPVGRAISQYPPANAIDNNPNSYSSIFWGGPVCGFELTPQRGATVVTGLKLTTPPKANAGESDPTSYKLEGKLANGSYVTIATGNLSLADGGEATETVLFSNDVAYTTYRLTFPTLRTKYTNGKMNIAEVSLLEQATADLRIVNGAISDFRIPVEGFSLSADDAGGKLAFKSNQEVPPPYAAYQANTQVFAITGKAHVAGVVSKQGSLVGVDLGAKGTSGLVLNGKDETQNQMSFALAEMPWGGNTFRGDTLVARYDAAAKRFKYSGDAQWLFEGQTIPAKVVVNSSAPSTISGFDFTGPVKFWGLAVDNIGTRFHSGDVFKIVSRDNAKATVSLDGKNVTIDPRFSIVNGSVFDGVLKLAEQISLGRITLEDFTAQIQIPPKQGQGFKLDFGMAKFTTGNGTAQATGTFPLVLKDGKLSLGDKATLTFKAVTIGSLDFADGALKATYSRADQKFTFSGTGKFQRTHDEIIGGDPANAQITEDKGVLKLTNFKAFGGTVQESGSQLTLDVSLPNTNLTISNDGNKYLFTLAGAKWAVKNGTHITGSKKSTLEVTPAGKAHFDTIKITDSAKGTSVTFNDSGSNKYDDTFIVELNEIDAGTINFAGNGNTSFTGTAALSVSTIRDVMVNSGAKVQTEDGALLLSANQQSATTQGDFSGIEVRGTVQATGKGAVTVEGHAGTKSTSARISGVKVDGGTISGGTGRTSGGKRVFGGESGDLIVRGNTTLTASAGGTKPATGTGAELFGVLVTGSGTITSAGASVNVEGKGGTGAGGSHAGVFVDAGSTITAGGSGFVAVAGVGGGGESSKNVGVSVHGGTITSNATKVTVTGTGGGSKGASDGYGVSVTDKGTNNGTITAGGSGTILVNGRGGPGTGANNHGVNIAGGGKVTSANGSIVVDGVAGKNTGTGIVVDSAISHTGAGSDSGIALITDSLDITANGSVNAGKHAVAIRPLSSKAGINWGGDGSVHKLRLTSDLLNRVTAGKLQIGDLETPMVVTKGVHLDRSIDIQLASSTAIRSDLLRFPITEGPSANALTAKVSENRMIGDGKDINRSVLRFLTNGDITSKHGIFSTSDLVVVGFEPRGARGFKPLLYLPGGVTVDDNDNKLSTTGKIKAIEGDWQGSKFVPTGFRDLLSGIVDGDANQRIQIPFARLTGDGFTVTSGQAATLRIDDNSVLTPTKLKLVPPRSQNNYEARIELNGKLGFTALDGAGVRLDGDNKFLGGPSGFTLKTTGGTLPIAHIGGDPSGKKKTSTPITFTLGGLKFQTSKLDANYDAAQKRFSFSGSATAHFEGGSLGIRLLKGLDGDISKLARIDKVDHQERDSWKVFDDNRSTGVGLRASEYAGGGGGLLRGSQSRPRLVQLSSMD